MTPLMPEEKATFEESVGTSRFKGRHKLARTLDTRRSWKRKKFKEQEGRCFYCGCAMMLDGAHDNQGNKCTLDHYIPLSKDGADHWENVVACCQRCNRKKRNMHPEHFLRPKENTNIVE